MNWYKKAQLEKIYTKQDMISMGADGYLSNAILLYIPIDKITGRDPAPATYMDEKGKEKEFKKGKIIKCPIEVEYQKDNDTFILYAGNHRIRQAEINKEEYIPAFVGIENDDVDEFSKLMGEYELV